MKKICDCCLLNYPNVHGYCPTATNVYCIVESCGTDPRLQTAAITTLNGTNNDWLYSEIGAIRYPNGCTVAILTDASDELVQAVAIPVAELSQSPIVLCSPFGAAQSVLDRIAATGATTVRIIGANISGTVDTALSFAGYTVQRVGSSTNIATFSQEVATWFLSQVPSTPEVVVYAEPLPGENPRRIGDDLVRLAQSSDDDITSASIGPFEQRWRLPFVTAFAARRREPLIIGIDAAVALGRNCIAVGSTAAALQIFGSGVFTVSVIKGANEFELSVQLAAVASRPGLGDVLELAMCTDDFTPKLGLAATGKPLLVYKWNDVDSGGGYFQWRRAAQGSPTRLNRLWLSSWGWPISANEFWKMQAYLNGFDAHLLVGVSGQGLPVISQPFSERPIGFAYVGPAGIERQVEPQPYWSGGRRR
jgi:hypothetical protein